MVVHGVEPLQSLVPVILDHATVTAHLLIGLRGPHAPQLATVVHKREPEKSWCQSVLEASAL